MAINSRTNSAHDRHGHVCAALSRTFAVALAAIILSSCVELDYALLRQHVVMANPDGRIIDIKTRNEMTDTEARAYIDTILEQAATTCGERCIADPRGVTHRILIHVHGGLNSYRGGLEQAQQIAGRMAAEAPADWHYPIFVVWPSGGLDSYYEHAAWLRLGHHEWWAPLTSPMVVASDGLGGLAKSVYTIPLQFIMDLSNAAEIALSVPVQPETRGVARIEAAMVSADPPSGVTIGKGDFVRGFWRQLWRGSTWLLFQPFKVATLPIVDGAGNGAWKVMLRRTHNLYRPASSLDVARLDASEVRQAIRREADGAMAFLFERLDHRFRGDMKARITLVAHSMGAIIVNTALWMLTEHDDSRSEPRREMPIDDVVYMAPACSIAETERLLVPFLEQNSKTRFHVLTLHPLAEFSERQGLDLVPRGSLLTWIEYWFASAPSHGDRRLGIWDSVVQALSIFKPVANRVAIKAFGVQDGSLPQRHGDFNDCPFWRRSFWAPADRTLFAADWHTREQVATVRATSPKSKQ